MNDIEEYDSGFKADPMYDQLAKIIDSASAAEVFKPTGRVKDYFRHFNPVTSVVTDDGDSITVTVDEARLLRELAMKTPSQKRLEYFKCIQTTSGLKDILEEIKDFSV